MTGRAIFLTHAEVVIDPATPVTEWGLSAEGHRRHAAFAASEALAAVSTVCSSTERRAVDAAAPVAERLGLPLVQHADLGENDRSATGYLPPEAFWPMVDRFFGAPDLSADGWETARAAQHRIVSAVGRVLAQAAAGGDVLIVAHGGVGALLRHHLLGRDIDRTQGQPHPGGGCWFAFDRAMSAGPTDWRII